MIDLPEGWQDYIVEEVPTNALELPDTLAVASSCTQSETHILEDDIHTLVRETQQLLESSRNVSISFRH